MFPYFLSFNCFPFFFFFLLLLAWLLGSPLFFSTSADYCCCSLWKWERTDFLIGLIRSSESTFFFISCRNQLRNLSCESVIGAASSISKLSFTCFYLPSPREFSEIAVFSRWRKNLEFRGKQIKLNSVSSKPKEKRKYSFSLCRKLLFFSIRLREENWWEKNLPRLLFLQSI